MQGQYGAVGDKRLSRVAADMWREWGFRRGVMRGFWVFFFKFLRGEVRFLTPSRIGNNCKGNTSLCRVMSLSHSLRPFNILTVPTVSIKILRRYVYGRQRPMVNSNRGPQAMNIPVGNSRQSTVRTYPYGLC